MLGDSGSMGKAEVSVWEGVESAERWVRRSIKLRTQPGCGIKDVARGSKLERGLGIEIKNAT